MNTTKKLISLTLAAAMSLSLAACGGGGTSAGSTPPPSGSSTGSGAVQSVADYDIQPELDSSVDYTQGDSYSFIIATDGAEDRVDGLLVHYMADQLNAITGGRIQLQMYFNGSMGTDTELCESTQAGDVAFFLGSTAFTANFVPELKPLISLSSIRMPNSSGIPWTMRRSSASTRRNTRIKALSSSASSTRACVR